MAVGGNEDSLIGFLGINPSRRVQSIKLPKTHTQKTDNYQQCL